MATVRGPQPGRKATKQSAEESPGSISDQPQLLTPRAAIIFFAALMIGIAAGTLAYLAGGRPAAAVLTGGAAFAGSVALLNRLIS